VGGIHLTQAMQAASLEIIPLDQRTTYHQEEGLQQSSIWEVLMTSEHY
jgi:hypothetical protein